ncbi:hypothetical protein [Sulfuricurvum sp.]|uniref:hypothetical protein n=1 Tax=Sulfuricurvum sp. TaxID=2025608 RepID=UPI003BAEFCDA
MTTEEENVTTANNNHNDYFDLCIAKIKKSSSPEVISFAWLILWLLLVPGLFFWLNDKSMSDIKDIPLNNIGDYLSGVAAPIAFLWLVLGYKQQGEELSINNEMLRLQHEELKSSVAAQVDQASSMKQQIDLLIMDKYFPKFKLDKFEFNRIDDFIEINIKNTSNEVDGINVAVLSNNMVIIDTYTSDNITYISLQTAENIGNDFDMNIELEFDIETGTKVKRCFLLHYNEFRHAGRLPDFNKIVCGENR